MRRKETKRRKRESGKVNGGNDDYVSDETTQTVKDRDNALHLILHRTYLAHIHLGGDSSQHAQKWNAHSTRRSRWRRKKKEANIAPGFLVSFRVIFISLQSIGNYTSEILHLGLHTHIAIWPQGDFSVGRQRIRNSE